MRDARTPRAQTTVRRELRTRLKQQQRVDQREDDEIGKRNGWETAQPAINRFAHGTSSLWLSLSLSAFRKPAELWLGERQRI